MNTRKILLSTALCSAFALAAPALAASAAGGAGATSPESAQTGAPMNTDSTTTVKPTASDATPADPTSDATTSHAKKKSNMSKTSTTPDANAQARPPINHYQPQTDQPKSDDSSAMQKGSENNAATAPQQPPQ